jgi:hypothetical protein
MPINFNIGSFFDKFKNAALTEMRLRQIIVDSVEKNTSIKLDLKDVAFKNKIIRIQASPVAKSQIFMKKESILLDVRTALPGFIASDLQ